jgi:hypothetical protein
MSHLESGASGQSISNYSSANSVANNISLEFSRYKLPTLLRVLMFPF